MTVRLRWICLSLALWACHGQSERPVGPQPAALTRLIATHAFDRMLPDGWQLGRLFASGTQIRIELVDASGGEHSILLVLPGPDGGQFDGRGTLYVYRFVRGADTPRNSQVLLWAAGIVDAAMGSASPVSPSPVPPPTGSGSGPALSGLKGMGAVPPSPEAAAPAATSQSESVPAAGDGAPVTEPGLTVPRPVALTLGALESVAVIAAIVIGILLSGVLSPRSDESGPTH